MMPRRSDSVSVMVTASWHADGVVCRRRRGEVMVYAALKLGRQHPTFWSVFVCMCAEGSAHTLSTAGKACNGSQFSKSA